jgi:hypothetical protein
MHDLSLWTFYGVILMACLLIVLTIVGGIGVCLLWRTSAAGDASRTIEAIVVMGDSVENMRAQNSAEHGSILSTGMDTNLSVHRILTRFGFLTSKELPLATDLPKPKTNGLP